MVGAWSSACPPGDIKPGKLWKVFFRPVRCATYVGFYWYFQRKSEMGNTIVRGMDFSPFWFITLQTSHLFSTRRGDEVALAVREKIGVTQCELVGR